MQVVSHTLDATTNNYGFSDSQKFHQICTIQVNASGRVRDFVIKGYQSLFNNEVDKVKNDGTALENTIVLKLVGVNDAISRVVSVAEMLRRISGGHVHQLTGIEMEVKDNNCNDGNNKTMLSPLEAALSDRGRTFSSLPTVSSAVTKSLPKITMTILMCRTDGVLNHNDPSYQGPAVVSLPEFLSATSEELLKTVLNSIDCMSSVARKNCYKQRSRKQKQCEHLIAQNTGVRKCSQRTTVHNDTNLGQGNDALSKKRCRRGGKSRTERRKRFRQDFSRAENAAL